MVENDKKIINRYMLKSLFDEGSKYKYTMQTTMENRASGGRMEFIKLLQKTKVWKN